MFVSADTNRIYHTLNTLKAADNVLFLTSVHGLNEDIDHIMSCVVGQGIPPNPIVAVTDLHTLPKKVCLIFYLYNSVRRFILGTI